jgi:hypothetical protein
VRRRAIETTVILSCLIVLASTASRAADPAAAAPDDGVPAPAAPKDDVVIPEPSENGEPIDGDHETPKAGEAFETHLLGQPVEVEPRDRSNTMAVVLGAALWDPSIGGTSAVPMASFYYRDIGIEDRIRAQVSGLVNEIEYAHRTARPIELIARLENDHRRVFGDSEILDDVKLEDTDLRWGGDSLWLGTGWQLPLKPFAIDNDLRLQLFYRVGHLYFGHTDDTAPDLAIPPSTIEHGPWLRLRIDTIQRNLLELPHNGVAIGADASLTFRDRWDQFRPEPGERDPFVQDVEPRHWKSSGYAVVTSPIPYLSERHRIEFQVNGAWAPAGTLDRYSAFRLGGGPLPKESADLSRESYPGALFDQFIAEHYATVSLEYRVELLFFVYLHLRGTVFHGTMASLSEGGEASDDVRWRGRNGQVLTTALTTGFPWDSSLYLEYDLDSGLLQDGDLGHAFMLLWSKSL